MREVKKCIISFLQLQKSTSFIDCISGILKLRMARQLDQNSYLIRDQFDITDIEQIRNESRGIQTGTLKVMLNTLLLKASNKQ